MKDVKHLIAIPSHTEERSTDTCCGEYSFGDTVFIFEATCAECLRVVVKRGEEAALRLSTIQQTSSGPEPTRGLI